MGWPQASQPGGTSSPDGSAVDALTDSMQSVSFSSPDMKRGMRNQSAPRRKNKRPCPEELEEARTRTIYVSDLNKGITETELVRWFGVAGHVLECRICSDMNTSKRFAFVEFADQDGFEQGVHAPDRDSISEHVRKSCGALVLHRCDRGE
jgi:RNA recognition motif-containing protein